MAEPAGVPGVRRRDVFDRAAASYDAVIPFFATFAARLVSAAGLEPGERVLDLACGRAAVARAAAARVGMTGYVLGIDRSAVMIERARKDIVAAGIRNVGVRVADARHLDVRDASFGAVLCGFGVFFFPDPVAALLECRRVLRAGGRFAASTFRDGRSGFPWLRDALTEIGRDPGLPSQRSPVRTAQGLRQVLVDTGFAETCTVQVEERFVFRDVDAYIAWTLSHGGRRMLESLGDDDLTRLRTAIARRLEAHAVPSGYELCQRVELTLARRL